VAGAVIEPLVGVKIQIYHALRLTNANDVPILLVKLVVIDVLCPGRGNIRHRKFRQLVHNGSGVLCKRM